MADVTGTLKKLENHAANIHFAAEQAITADLDDVVNVDTGGLKKSRRIARSQTSQTIRTEITYPPKTANWTDEGTRPHTIHGQPILRFVKGGKVIYARKVNHPGNKPYRWWSKTMTRRNWQRALKTASKIN